jgi:hypothetical protein
MRKQHDGLLRGWLFERLDWVARTTAAAPRVPEQHTGISYAAPRNASGFTAVSASCFYVCLALSVKTRVYRNPADDGARTRLTDLRVGAWIEVNS